MGRGIWTGRLRRNYYSGQGHRGLLEWVYDLNIQVVWFWTGFSRVSGPLETEAMTEHMQRGELLPNIGWPSICVSSTVPTEAFSIDILSQRLGETSLVPTQIDVR